MKNWSVYILENPEGRTYVGQTQDIEVRIKRHNRGSGEMWTQGKGVWSLIYTETFKTRSEAIKREKKLKSLKLGKRMKILLKISPNNPL